VRAIRCRTASRAGTHASEDVCHPGGHGLERPADEDCEQLWLTTSWNQASAVRPRRGRARSSSRWSGPLTEPLRWDGERVRPADRLRIICTRARPGCLLSPTPSSRLSTGSRKGPALVWHRGGPSRRTSSASSGRRREDVSQPVDDQPMPAREQFLVVEETRRAVVRRRTDRRFRRVFISTPGPRGSRL